MQTRNRECVPFPMQIMLRFMLLIGVMLTHSDTMGFMNSSYCFCSLLFLLSSVFLSTAMGEKKTRNSSIMLSERVLLVKCCSFSFSIQLQHHHEDGESCHLKQILNELVHAKCGNIWMFNVKGLNFLFVVSHLFVLSLFFLLSFSQCFASSFSMDKWCAVSHWNDDHWW